MGPATARCCALRTSVLVLLACISTSQAADIAPAWRVDVETPIVWEHVTTLGDLIVATTDALHAIDAETGRLRWSRSDLGNLVGGSFEELVGTPLAVVDDGRPDTRTVILDVLDGTLVFDSRAENLTQIASRFILPRSGSLLIAGFEVGNATPTLFLYAIDDGRRLWASDALGAGLGGFMRMVVAAAIVLTATSPVQSEPVELDDGTFILGAMGNLYRFDRDSGEVLWKTPFAGGRFELVRVAQRPELIFAGAEETNDDFVSTQYQAFRIDGGEPIWKRPVRFSKPMNALVIPTDRGLIVSEGDSNKGRIVELGYDDGESSWGRRGRGIAIKGQVLDYAFTDAGLLLTTGYDSIWSNRDTEYLLYVVDTSTGTLRFEEPLEVRGRVLTTEPTEHGLLYVTTHEIDIFDPASGVVRNGHTLRSRQPLAWTRDATHVHAYSSDSGQIYRLARARGRVEQVTSAPFHFDDDTALTLDSVAESLVLIGQQSVASFGTDGALRFAVHFPAPRDPAWLRGLAWAAGIRAGMASAYAGLYSAAAASAAADAGAGTLEQQLAVGLQQGFGELQHGYAGLAKDYVEFARRRYQASAESRDFVFMMTRDEDRGISLVQVGKLDGQARGRIDLGRDKEPSYQVDAIANRIFYRSAPTVIAGYSF